MSSISSVGGSFSSSAYSQTQTASGRRGHGPQRLDNDLTSFLTQQRVSSDEQSQILAEVKSQLTAQRSNSSGRPDRTQLIDTVSGVLQSHGLDSDKFAQSIPAPPERSGAQASPPPPDSDDDSQDALKQLLDLLAKAWKKALKQSESSSNAPSATTATIDATTVNSSPSSSAVSQNTDSSSPYQAIIELSASQGELNQLV